MATDDHDAVTITAMTDLLGKSVRMQIDTLEQIITKGVFANLHRMKSRDPEGFVVLLTHWHRNLKQLIVASSSSNSGYEVRDLGHDYQEKMVRIERGLNLLSSQYLPRPAGD